ncbi:MAG: DUF2975 domain-containing protein [Tabrizicola sp.]|jgi:hypothetical protein|nr:DUF2975 domain-containing protein [Tabrizicola sp.]
MKERFTRLSQTLYWTALALSVVLPVLVLLYAGKAVSDPASLLSRVPGLPPDMTVTRSQAALVAAIALISVLPMLAALRAMARLFDSYRAGDILSDANAGSILTIGRALLLVAFFTVLTPTLQTLILSWNGPQRMLSIGLDGGTLGFALAAGLLTVIGWAMGEAARIKAENEGFV